MANLIPLRRRALVVEDDPAARHLMVSALRAGGHDVTWTDSATGLLECILATGETTWDCVFDVIVSDIALPDHNALDILAVLRRRLVKTPVVLLTADPSDANRCRARALDAAAFLPKPVAVSTLRAAVDDALALEGVRDVHLGGTGS